MDRRLKSKFPYLPAKLDQISSSIRFFSEFLSSFRQLKLKERADDDEDETRTEFAEITENDESDYSLEELGLFKFKTDNEIHVKLSEINYHTMIRCLSRKNLESAKQLNDDVLGVLPTNFLGLWNRVVFLSVAALVFDYPCSLQREETLEILEEVSNDETEILIAKAEVAFMYTLMDRSTEALNKSIELYDEVFEEIERLPGSMVFDHPFPVLVVTWKQDMAWNYIRLMDEDRKGPDKYPLYYKITRLLEPLTEDEQIDGKTRASILLQLVDASNCVTCHESRNRKQRDVTSLKLLEQAGSLDAGNDGIVLKIARYMRRGATSVTELKNVIERLKVCHENGHQRNVVCHHLGLAYRSLWILGHEGPVPAILNHVRSPHRVNKSSSLKAGHIVIRPPLDIVNSAQIPKPYKQIPKNLQSSQSNPLSREENDPYLLEARRYFKEADELSDDSGCLMLVELARTYVSSGDVSKARECFLNALKRTAIAQSAVYLFEQMGMLEETQLNDDDIGQSDYSEKLENIKSIYREAIRYDTRSTTRAVIAFHRLLDILYYQTQDSDADLITQSEYFLIYMAIQQAESPYELIEALINDDIKINLIWKLVEMFHGRNEAHASSAVFTYLSILGVNDKLAVKVRGVKLSVRDKVRILLESAVNVALEKAVPGRYLPQTYDWLCQLDDFDKDNNSSDTNPFAILVDEINIKNLATVKQIIKKQLLREKSAVIFISNSTKIDELLTEIQKFQSIVLIVDDKNVGSKLFDTVRAVMTDPSVKKKRTCRAVFDNADRKTSRPISSLSEWNIDCDATPSLDGNDIRELETACRLLRALFKLHA